MIHDVHSRDAIIIISTERESVVIMVQNVPSRDAICKNGTYENGMCGNNKKEGGDDDGTCAVSRRM